jgi:formylglycine-generating enzyme required for sulfatase activity
LLAVICLAGLSLLPACASPNAGSRNPKDGMTFVWVPAGSLMAQVPVELKDTSDPEKTVAQEVTFAEGFWLGRTEVTVGQFRRFVEQTGHVTDAEKAGNRFTWKSPGFPQEANHPVVYLSYQDALCYTRWAGVDLPTEAEWLYACRAGSTTKFYWGDLVDDRYLWHRGNTEGTSTRPVARKRPNAWGLYDMVGNAWEYCKVGDACFATRGGSWTRCPQYRTRQGTLTGCLLEEAVEPRLQRCDPNPKYPPYPWDDDRGFRCIRRTPEGPSPPAHAGSPTMPSPHQKEIEDLLHVRCAGCRSMKFLRLGGMFNTTLVSFEVPARSLSALLEQSDRLPRRSELGNKPTGFAFMKQFETRAAWWRPSELEEAKCAYKTWVTRHENDPHFEQLSTMSVVTGETESGWVRVYICYQAEIVPRLS